MKILVTGGAGFIGSSLVRLLLSKEQNQVVVLDSLTYAGLIDNLSECLPNPHYSFVHGDVANIALVSEILEKQAIDIVYHLAAETHVDRSIDNADPFVHSNIVGTYGVLEAIRRTSRGIRLMHVSTDEVYGTLTPTQEPFLETSLLNPSSPYAASKASADMLVKAYVATHGVDAVISRCCNNYGYRQFPEKLIPISILRALKGMPILVYGDGAQQREWIHVTDHCRALVAMAEKAQRGAIYNVGTGHEEKNIDVISRIVQITGADPAQIEHGADRPAHDIRYAINASKVRTECGWAPLVNFEQGFTDCVQWYVEHYQTTNVEK